MTAVNFLSIKKLANTNSAITWWKVGVPSADHFVLAVVSHFQTQQLHRRGRVQPLRRKGILSAVSTSGIIFALLGFEQADQLAGESNNPRRDIPRAVIGPLVIGIFIYIALQIVFLGRAARPRRSGTPGRWEGAGFTSTSPGRSSQVATAKRRVARGDHLRRRDHLARAGRA